MLLLSIGMSVSPSRRIPAVADAFSTTRTASSRDFGSPFFLDDLGQQDASEIERPSEGEKALSQSGKGLRRPSLRIPQ